jgi:hypothetical protein
VLVPHEQQQQQETHGVGVMIHVEPFVCLLILRVVVEVQQTLFSVW